MKVWIKTPIFKNGDYEIDCECDESLKALRYVGLLLSRAELFLRKGHKLKSQWEMVTESGSFVKKNK